MKKILYIALVALCVAACTPPAVDESKLFLTEAQAEELIAQGECLTIEEFKARYMTEEGNYCIDSLYRQRSKAGSYYLFSIDTIPVSATPIYTVKRLRRRSGKIWLMPENDNYEPIDGTEAELIGLVKAVVREY